MSCASSACPVHWLPTLDSGDSVAKAGNLLLNVLIGAMAVFIGLRVIPTGSEERAAPGPLQPSMLATLRDSLWALGTPLVEGPHGGGLIVFSRYDCPACSSMEPILTELMSRDPSVPVAIIHLPENRPDSSATIRARVAICASQLGDLGFVHRSLFSAGWKRELLAMGVPLSSRTWEECMAAPETARRIEAGMELARALGLRGTPTTVSGANSLVGVAGVDELLTLIPHDREGY